MKKGYWIWALVALLVIGGGVVYYAFFYHAEPEATNQQTNSEAAEEPEANANAVAEPESQKATASWKSYFNAESGLSFKYPENFEKKTDEVVHEYSDTQKWYRVDVEGTDPDADVVLRVEIDPDGYGPFFPDNEFKIEQDANGVVHVVQVIPSDDATVNMGSWRSNGSLHYLGSFEASNGKNVMVQLTGPSDKSPDAYVDLFTAFVESIRLNTNPIEILGTPQ